jgi:APA family basic amino acid/polyamine antiporter
VNQRDSTATRLGLVTLTFLVVANMIGAGVYSSSGYALGDLESAGLVMLVWLVAGLFALLGAVCYGGLAQRVSESGGEYLFLSRAFHPLAGYMAGWVSLTAGFSGAIAIAALAFDGYLGTEAWQIGGFRIIPLALIVTFGVFHLIGLMFGAAIQNVLVVVKLTWLVGFVLFAVWRMASGALDVPAAGLEGIAAGDSEVSWAQLATSLMWISFSYAGYNAAVYVAGATTGAATVARSMWLATVIVTLLYLALNAVVLYGVPAERLVGEKEVFKIAARWLGGEWVAWLVSGVILLSLATSVSAMLQAGPHVYAQMARDGVLPGFLRADPAGIPRAATVLQIVLAAALTVRSNLPELLEYVAFLLLLSSAATVGTLLVPRKLWRDPYAVHVERVWGWPLTPALFVVFSLLIAWLALRFRWENNPTRLARAVLVLPLGLFLYPLFCWWGRVPEAASGEDGAERRG